MPSKRQQAANRRNSQKSTGPTSEKGKATSSLNAVRHGLSSKSASDPETEALVDKLAREFLTAAKRGVSVMHLARNAAEAQVQMLRIQNLKRQAWRPSASDADIKDRGKFWPLFQPGNEKKIKTIGEYPVGGLKKIMPHFFLKPLSDAEQNMALKLAPTKRLYALIRYERRFANRRDRALRELAEHVA